MTSKLDDVSPDSEIKQQKSKSILGMIGRGAVAALNITANSVKTLEKLSEVAYTSTVKLNEDLYNSLSPESKAEVDAVLKEIDGDKDK